MDPTLFQMILVQLVGFLAGAVIGYGIAKAAKSLLIIGFGLFALLMLGYALPTQQLCLGMDVNEAMNMLSNIFKTTIATLSKNPSVLLGVIVGALIGVVRR